VLFGCLAVCMMIVASSWPQKKHNQVARGQTDAPVAVVRFTDLQGSEVVPVVYQTGTIRPVDPRR
jgi:hypothetical protein